MRGQRGALVAALAVLAAACGGDEDGGESTAAGCGGKGDVLAVSRDVDNGTPEVLIVRTASGEAEQIAGDWEDEWGRVPLSQPSFSPDGERLVVVKAVGDYESSGPLSTTLWTMRLDGRDRRALTEGAEVLDDDPAWSPDGEQVVFSEQLRGEVWSSRLAVVPAAGGERRPLLADDRAGSTRADVRTELESPAWSPDGTQIAFVRWELPLDTDEASVATVMVASADGREIRELAAVPAAERVSWAPDGASLLVSAEDAEDGTISIVDAAHGNVDEVVDHASIGTWSPDGEHIYFAARVDQDDDHSWRLRTARLDGDHQDVGDVELGYLYTTAEIAVAPCATDRGES